MTPPHVPPSDCPVCGDRLEITGLGCRSCGTAVTGRFASCPYCSLDQQEQKILRNFLVSRGNMRELARVLGVSYPTARQRFADLLVKLGLEEETGEAAPAQDRETVLRRLAAGELDLDQAAAILSERTG